MPGARVHLEDTERAMRLALAVALAVATVVCAALLIAGLAVLR